MAAAPSLANARSHEAGGKGNITNYSMEIWERHSSISDSQKENIATLRATLHQDGRNGDGQKGHHRNGNGVVDDDEEGESEELHGKREVALSLPQGKPIETMDAFYLWFEQMEKEVEKEEERVFV